MEISNASIAKLLRSVAAALTLKKMSIFQVRAYETAADAIEHSTAEVKDLWEEGKLDDIPGLGQNLQMHLNELFKTGKVLHFESLMEDYPPVLFEMLDIPGVGPKIAYELTSLGVKSLEELKKKLKSGKLQKRGFSDKIGQKILMGLLEQSSEPFRMLLPYASFQAQKILEYLKKGPGVKTADPLGSLRRQVATVGDLDFAASSDNPEKVVEYFTKMPGVKRIVGQGEFKATVILISGIQVDLLVGKPSAYGALLQHFTGSKPHNIHLRTLAERKGLSLSEYGVKKISDKKQIISCETEGELYKMLGMNTPPPEIREDTGEIEAALAHKLPKLIELNDIKGDLHLHSNYPFDHPSHGPGVNTMDEIVKIAIEKGYEFLGISDHPPAFGKHSSEELTKIIEKRSIAIQSLRKRNKSIRILNALEIDILGDGSLSIPDEALKTLDYCIAGIHSGHRSSSGDITRRILKALENPYVDVISHPSGRILNDRPSYEANWTEIFKSCAKFNKILEIDGYPNRLDLRDDLVRMAKEYGVKFIIDTDAHEVSQMDNMPFGVSVARRGWAEKSDIVNAWDWKDFSKWFKLTL